MCCIKKHRNASAFEQFNEFFKRHPKSSRACHRIDHCQHCSVAHTSHDGIDGDLWAFNREGNVDGDDLCTPTLSHEINGVPTGLVSVVGYEDFIALLEDEGTKNSVDSSGRIFHQCQIIRVAFKHCCKSASGLLHESHRKILIKPNRFVLQQILPLLLFLTNGNRRGSKRAVVEEDTLFIEQPMFGKLTSLWERHSPWCTCHSLNV